mgnify:FL=1|jgi:hypothetical protein
MRETRLSGSEGGAGSIPVPTPILGSASGWQRIEERERARSLPGVRERLAAH